MVFFTAKYYLLNRFVLVFTTPEDLYANTTITNDLGIVGGQRSTDAPGDR